MENFMEELLAEVEDKEIQLSEKLSKEHADLILSEMLKITKSIEENCRVAEAEIKIIKDFYLGKNYKAQEKIEYLERYKLVIEPVRSTNNIGLNADLDGLFTKWYPQRRVKIESFDKLRTSLRIWYSRKAGRDSTCASVLFNKKREHISAFPFTFYFQLFTFSFFFRTPERNRTSDLWFRKPLLYPLSYRGIV